MPARPPIRPSFRTICVAMAISLLAVDPAGAYTDLTQEDWTEYGLQAGEDFGHAVRSAGDVNGDGYTDLVIGSPLHDTTFTNNGRVDVYYGDASGLPEDPDWTRYGYLHSMKYGFAVDCAGDVNGDGYDDLIVGAPGYEVDVDNAGAAFVYHGGPNGLGTSADWWVAWSTANASYGRSVAGVGDVNGDGYDDVVVGAPYRDGFGSDVNVGGAYFYPGSAAGLAAQHTDDFGGGYLQVWSLFGYSVTGAGDVNADGYDDIAIGIPFFDSSFSNAGRVDVYLGGPGVHPTYGWALGGTGEGQTFGYSVAAAGDLDLNGYADLVVGAPAANDGDGYFRVVYTGASGPLTLSIHHGAGGENLGYSVCSAGDLNGDGHPEVVAGAPFRGSTNQGGIFVVYGSGGESPATGSRSFQSDGSANYGHAVTCAGDLDGDGFSDLAVGGRNATPAGGSSVGGVKVILGAADDSPSLIASWQGTPDETLGRALTGVGDVNGDGFDDLLLADREFDGGGSSRGRIRLHFGRAIGIDPAEGWADEGVADGSRLGDVVSACGDLNGDGYADFAAATGTSELFVYLGGASTPSPQPAAIAIPTATYGETVLHTAGDPNGDGYADLLVGLPRWDGDLEDEGLVRLYWGSPSGLNPSAYLQWEGDGAGIRFGWALAGVGDVNADGIDDIAASAPYANPGGGSGYDGSVRVAYGSPTGPGPWEVHDGHSSHFLGRSLDRAGDVDGDGFADFVAGAPSGGAIWIFRGSPTGVSGLVLATSAGLDVSGLGDSVAGLGDVNGDGYSDVVAGATVTTTVGIPPFPIETYVHGALAFVLGGPPAPFTPYAVRWINGGLEEVAYGETLAACGDFDGDGFADLAVGARDRDPDGAVDLFSRNESVPGSARARWEPRQRTGSGDPIALAGAAPASEGVELSVWGRSPAGRSRVRLEWQVASSSAPFGPIQTGPWVDTGAPGSMGSRVQISTLLSGLQGETSHRWRLRVACDHPLFRGSRWLTNQPASAVHSHFRTTSGSVVGLAEARSGVFLQAPRPNPFGGRSVVRFALGASQPVRLEVLDVRGRRVTTLVDGILSAGTHSVPWNGADASGRPTASGVYFLRLETASDVSTQKVTKLR